MDKATLKKWLKVGYLYQHVWNETETGTPQGGIISPVIMNIALDGLEKLLEDKFSPTTREKRWNKGWTQQVAEPHAGQTSQDDGAVCGMPSLATCGAPTFLEGIDIGKEWRAVCGQSCKHGSAGVAP